MFRHATSQLVIAQLACSTRPAALEQQRREYSDGYYFIAGQHTSISGADLYFWRNLIAAPVQATTATALLLTCQLGLAEAVHPLLEDKHTFVLGGYQQDADAQFYAEADDVAGGSVDLGDLGMDESDTTLILEYRYRLNDRWELSAAGYKFDTSGSLRTQRDVVYDGQEFEAGARVDSSLDTNTYLLAAMYKLYKTGRAYVSVGGGFHIFEFSTELETRVAVGEAESSRSRAGDDITTPLPNLRMEGFYALSPNWALISTIGWLSLDYDDYEGSFVYAYARANYRITERFGLGIGYQYLDMDFSVDRDRGEAGFDIQFNGPSVHLGYSF
ncbi:MAG: hypothetical protein ACJAUG_000768 [Halioglobus sp.]|jgi:hypothetical protein